MFHLLDESTWERAEHFRYYRQQLPCQYSLTAELDVTRFLEEVRRRGLRSYPAMLWCIGHTVHSAREMRMAVDEEGRPGYYDVVHPVYTIFHPEDHTFSDLWTPWDEDFDTFYGAVTADMARYGAARGPKPKPDQPANFFCVSCVPWVHYTGYSSVVPGGFVNLFPIVTYGKFQEREGRTTAPFTLTIGHAAADGWHSARFFQTLQETLERF